MTKKKTNEITRTTLMVDIYVILFIRRVDMPAIRPVILHLSSKTLKIIIVNSFSTIITTPFNLIIFSLAVFGVFISFSLYLFSFLSPSHFFSVGFCHWVFALLIRIGFQFWVTFDIIFGWRQDAALKSLFVAIKWLFYYRKQWRRSLDSETKWYISLNLLSSLFYM